jgi:hypothetical protein
MFEREQEYPEPSRLNAGAQLTNRLETFGTITGEQGALCFDQAQRWLGLLSPAADRMKEAGLLSTERTRKILHPWRIQGYLDYKIYHNGHKGWYWLTSKGLRYFNVQLRYYEPVPSTLAHLYALNNIRYMIAIRRPTDVWRSERILRAEQYATKQKNKLAHLPDGEILSATNNTVKAVELELSIKNEKYIQDVVLDLAANKRYSSIWYFLPPNVKSTIHAAIHKLPQEHQKRFTLYNLKGELYTA